ncbi:Transposase, partial [Ruminococcus sp. YE71]|uniref:DDE-type integrase/transposase/recombinase n=2 Tax=unclassified Ruminococcus TaxID=2608920 RepID=UPI000908FE0E
MGSERKYDNEFKKQAVKLAKEIGSTAAVAELGIPKSTLATWVRKAKAGEIDTGSGTRLPEESLNLAQQLQAANKRIKELERKNRELDCYDLMPLGLAIEDNMRASLCVHTLENAKKAYPEIKGCIIHSDRGSQYTSTEYRTAIQRFEIIQSMNSAGGRCHDNARCESMWA